MTAAAGFSARRREFLRQGGAIVVGFSLASVAAFGQQSTAKPAALPGSLNNNRILDSWLRINADGTVTVCTGKVELGQGILTALAQMAADELDVGYERIRMLSADTSRSPNEGMTAGSQSIEQSGIALRYAAAEAREILLQLAAARLGVAADKLAVSDGTVTAGDAKTTYWEVAQNVNFKREATARVQPKPASRHQIIGKSVKRRDIPNKVAGKVSYVQDMRLPGMVFGRVVRPPTRRAQLVSCDEAAVRSLAGVVAVVRDGSFLAVAAEREEQADRESDHPVADEVRDHRRARLAEPAQHAARRDLDAVEHLEHARDRDQAGGDRDDRGIGRVEPREHAREA